MDKLVGAFSGVLKPSSTPTGQPAHQQADRQYLRLPLESARKLRWFEKADLQALTKSHFREKRELLDSISVLKKLLVRHGLDEAKLDAEVAAHLRTAQELAEEHEGVASVLLTALEAHVQQLRFENERLQATIKLGQHAAAPVTANRPDGTAAPTSSRSGSAGALPAANAGPHQLSTSGAPLPRRLDPLDLAQPWCSASTRTDLLAKQQVVALESRCEQYAKEVSELKAALTKQQQQATVGAGSRRWNADANEAVQDMLLSLQEAAREEARKASLADARATRMEGELKALQAQHKAVTKENAALQQQVMQLRQEMDAAAAAAEVRLSEAAVAGEGARAAAEAREEAAALRQSNANLQAELAAAQSAISRLEADLQLSHQREVATAAVLSEAEAVAHRTDELAAANLAMQQRLTECKAEMEMAAYYKKMCGELTQAKSQLEEQLMGLGSLLSGAELRLADMAARAATAEEHAALAECRARAAEGSIAAEVEKRCGTVLTSRTLWPSALRDEVEGMERRLARAEEERAEALQRAEASARVEEELRQQLAAKAEKLALLTNESAGAASSFASQLQQLREALAESQARAAGLQHDLSKSRAREEAASTAAAAAAAAAGTGRNTAVAAQRQSTNSSGSEPGSTLTAASSSSSLSSVPSTTAIMTPRWQVQNKVGGGGLYNLDAASASDGGSGGGVNSRQPFLHPSGAAATTPAPPGNVDAVYMKNVLFKFLEAHLTDKVQERDMLLPAVATLLQATQEEFVALQKILRATVPPSRQMLSVLGFSR